MSESEAAKVAGRLQGKGSVWDEDVIAQGRSVWDEAARQIAATFTMLRENVINGQPDEDAGRVAELERQLESDRHAAERGSVYWNCDRCNTDEHKCPGCGEPLNHWQGDCDDCRKRVWVEDATVELERQLAERTKHYEDQVADRNKLERKLTDALVRAETAEVALADALAEDHAQCYVAREVPWSDVAAGMMTIARDGTPWMVADVVHEPRLEVLLSKAQGVFPKSPAPGETVRVLVPYVTPEAAEELVRNELGGRA